MKIPKTSSKIPNGGVPPFYIVYTEKDVLNDKKSGDSKKTKEKRKQEFSTELENIASMKNIIESRRDKKLFVSVPQDL